MTTNQLKSDILYQQDYVQLYCKDGEQLIEFSYSEGEKEFGLIGLKIPIKEVAGIEIEECLYDVESGYGYGGLYCNSGDPVFLAKAYLRYNCFLRKHRVVAEFHRIHPFFSAIELHRPYLSMLHMNREVVVVDLAGSSELQLEGFPKKTRYYIRKAKSNPSLHVRPICWRGFKNLYNLTMERNRAESFYFFDEKYFSSLGCLDGTTILGVFKDCELVSAAVICLGPEVAHYHLSGNRSGNDKLFANYYLLEAAFDLAREAGCHYMLLGGGRTTDSNDSLLRFKKKFSKNVYPFYIAGRVVDSVWYERLRNIKSSVDGADKSNLFISYR